MKSNNLIDIIDLDNEVDILTELYYKKEISMKRIIIPEVEIELADNLFLRIREVEYIPREPTVMYYKDGSGYPGSDAEMDWNYENTRLIIRKVKYTTNDGGKSTKKEVSEYDFAVDFEFANNYYDELLNKAEEILNEN